MSGTVAKQITEHDNLLDKITGNDNLLDKITGHDNLLDKITAQMMSKCFSCLRQRNQMMTYTEELPIYTFIIYIVIT